MVIHKKRSISVCLSAILLFLTFLSGLALSIPRTMAIHEPAPATDIVDVININVPVSCSMSATGTDSHTANVNNGQTTENIGTTNLKVICNDNSGYAIYAIGYTDDTYGKTVLTSSTLGSTHDIATATTVTTGTSSWAMKLASVSGTYAPIIAGSTGDSLKQTGDPDFSNYTAVPEEYTKVAYHTTSTDTGTNATGSNLTTTYRAYISPTQPAGTYIGQVKYTLVHPNKVDNSNKPVGPMTPTDCPANSICYAPNASDIEGSMSSLGAITSSPKAGRISVGTSATTINLIAPNYKRAGFGFAGWSTDFEANNSSTVYGPNETITITAGSLSANGMILYPVWIAKDTTDTMQTFSSSRCNSMPQATYSNGTITVPSGSIIALEDERDGNVYTIAKLVDGKCWMTENLRLNNEATITTANTQSNNGSFGGVFTSLPQSVDLNWGSNTSNNLYTGLTALTLPQLNTNNTNIGGKNASGTDLSISHNTNNDHVQWYSYGNYYSWPAAIADTTAHDRNNEIVTSTSICPTGWRLPIGGQSTVNTTGDFYILTKTLMDGTEPNNPNSGYSYYQGTVDGVNLGATASSSLRNYPNNFIYSGYWYGSSARTRGSNGLYWSSSAYHSNYAYYLDFSSSIVYPGTTYGDKYNGFTVRCVAGGSGS